MSVEVVHTLVRSLGLDAEFNEVFVIRGPETPPLPPPQAPAQPTPPTSAPPFTSRLRPMRTLPRRVACKGRGMVNRVTYRPAEGYAIIYLVVDRLTHDPQPQIDGLTHDPQPQIDALLEAGFREVGS